MLSSCRARVVLVGVLVVVAALRIAGGGGRSHVAWPAHLPAVGACAS
ncbi:MAG: hypothetical protein M0Z93_06880 [Actinomycetota bacterium]|nr:hypothetical protein [Actinomycetota bacterium]